LFENIIFGGVVELLNIDYKISLLPIWRYISIRVTVNFRNSDKNDRFRQNYAPTMHLAIKISNIKLEIWGKAQRESARHPKSDWGKLRGEGKEGENFPGIKVTWPKLKCIGIRRTRFVDLG